VRDDRGAAVASGLVVVKVSGPVDP